MDRPGPDELLAAWAATHHGLYRGEDALRAGLSRRQVAHRVQQRRADRLGHDVFRVAGSAPTRDQRNLSAAWRTGGWASHRTALENLGCLEPRGSRPHVVVPRHRTHHVSGVVVHRSDDLLPSDLMVVRNVPTTTAARSLVDAGLILAPVELESAMHRALHAGRTTIEELVTTYRRISRRGRHGAGPIGELLRAYDASMPAAESDLEVVILRVLREHGVPEPERQLTVEVSGAVFRLDMAYPLHRVFLEGDGFGVHGRRSAFEDDRWRQNLLVVHGWWPLRITWRQAHREPRKCAEFVARKLAEVERGWA